MEKKKIWIIGLLGLLLLAVIFEKQGNRLGENAILQKPEAGDGSEDLELVLSADGMLKEYKYSLQMEERKLSQEEAEEYFQSAKKEIDRTFCGKSENVNAITDDVVIRDRYAGGMVRADWYFDDYRLIQPDGALNKELLSEEGELINAEVELRCQNYTELYAFVFRVCAKEMTETEALLKEIRGQIMQQMENEDPQIRLPKEANGISLHWGMAKEHVAVKVLGLVFLGLLCVKLLEKEQKLKREKNRIRQLELDYPEIVSHFAVLTGAGMTVHQAWNQISARYLKRREEKRTEIRPGYEELVLTSREIRDGKEEQLAYQRFGERTAQREYRRFSRLLTQNMKKGSKGLEALLERETEEAYRKRNLLAKKMGEEAGTKLLFTMMLMLGVVMAIVIAPAIMSF